LPTLTRSFSSSSSSSSSSILFRTVNKEDGRGGGRGRNRVSVQDKLGRTSVKKEIAHQWWMLIVRPEMLPTDRQESAAVVVLCRPWPHEDYRHPYFASTDAKDA